MRWLLGLASICLLAGLQGAAQTPPRAMWLWDSSPLLADAGARRDFFAFCERQRIGIVWAQIATSAGGNGRQVDRAADWKAFVAEAHRRDMKLHALDGDPHYALRDQHTAALAIVKAVVAYNATAAPNERFDGIHFDIEPHVLLDWRVPPLRERLLEAYLELNARAAAVAHDAGLAYGVDVPFWWPATSHLLGFVDNVGIMDYRTTATGPDGIIANATGTLQEAERLARPRVHVGVETSVERGDYLFLLGISSEAVHKAIVERSPSATLLDRHRARLVDDGAAVHVGVKLPGADDTLAEIARAFRVAPSRNPDQAAADAQAAFRREGEWLDVRPRMIQPGTASFAGVSATLMTPGKVTFAAKPLSEMTRELEQAETAFAGYRSYAGIAIHDYAAFRRLTVGSP